MFYCSNVTHQIVQTNTNRYSRHTMSVLYCTKLEFICRSTIFVKRRWMKRMYNVSEQTKDTVCFHNIVVKHKISILNGSFFSFIVLGGCYFYLCISTVLCIHVNIFINVLLLSIMICPRIYIILIYISVRKHCLNHWTVGAYDLNLRIDIYTSSSITYR